MPTAQDTPRPGQPPQPTAREKSMSFCARLHSELLLLSSSRGTGATLRNGTSWTTRPLSSPSPPSTRRRTSRIRAMYPKTTRIDSCMRCTAQRSTSMHQSVCRLLAGDSMMKRFSPHWWKLSVPWEDLKTLVYSIICISFWLTEFGRLRINWHAKYHLLVSMKRLFV